MWTHLRYISESSGFTYVGEYGFREGIVANRFRPTFRVVPAVVAPVVAGLTANTRADPIRSSITRTFFAFKHLGHRPFRISTIWFILFQTEYELGSLVIPDRI